MNTRAKQKSSSSKKKKTCTPKHDPETWATSEAALTEHLEEDLFEAWEKIRDFSSSLGQQRVYAAGKAIMFSKKTCFFFREAQEVLPGGGCLFSLSEQTKRIQISETGVEDKIRPYL